MGRKKITATDDELRHLYVDKQLRLREIADIYGCTASAVSMRLKAAGVECRNAGSYPATENLRAAWSEIGKLRKGCAMSEETKKKLSEAKKGWRARDDYEFGGHERKRSDGYIKVYVPDHPNSTLDGYVMKHILVIEREIGRYLGPEECVHHINHIRDDNRIDNLQLMTKSAHMSMHMKERHENRRNKSC